MVSAIVFRRWSSAFSPRRIRDFNGHFGALRYLVSRFHPLAMSSSEMNESATLLRGSPAIDLRYSRPRTSGHRWLLIAPAFQAEPNYL